MPGPATQDTRRESRDLAIDDRKLNSPAARALAAYAAGHSQTRNQLRDRRRATARSPYSRSAQAIASPIW
jgi:hypothetical protein